MNHNQYITEQPGKLEAQFSEIRKTMFGENFGPLFFPWSSRFIKYPTFYYMLQIFMKRCGTKMALELEILGGG